MKWHALVLAVSMPALANIAPPDRGPPAPEPAAAQANAEAQPEAAAPAPEAVAAPAPTPAPAAEHPGGNANAPGMKEHPGGNANAPGMQPMGVIEGGWSYVYAAWGAGVLGVLLYGASLFLRRPETPPPGAP